MEYNLRKNTYPRLSSNLSIYRVVSSLVGFLLGLKKVAMSVLDVSLAYNQLKVPQEWKSGVKMCIQYLFEDFQKLWLNIPIAVPDIFGNFADGQQLRTLWTTLDSASRYYVNRFKFFSAYNNFDNISQIANAWEVQRNREEDWLDVFVPLFCMVGMFLVNKSNKELKYAVDIVTLKFFQLTVCSVKSRVPFLLWTPFENIYWHCDN